MRHSAQPDLEVHSGTWKRHAAYPEHDFPPAVQAINPAAGVHNCNEAIMLWLDEQARLHPKQAEFKYYYITERTR